MNYRYIILFIISINCSLISNAKSKIDSLWLEANEAKNSAKEIDIICKIGDIYKKLEDKNAYDSCYKIVFNKIQFLNNTVAESEKFRQYFNLYDDNFYIKNENFANSYLKFANQNNLKNDLFYSNLILFKLSLEKNIETAENYLKNAQFYAASLNNPYFNALIMTSLGNLNEVRNNKINAYRNYLDAQILSQEKNFTELNYYISNRIINFLNLTKNYENAKAEAFKQVSIITQHVPVDSLKFYKTVLQISDIYFNLNDEENAEMYAYSVIKFAEAHQYSILKNDELGILRSKYFENNNLKKITELYSIRFPEELKKIEQQDTLTYFRIQSAIKENENKADSSLYYFKEAEKILSIKNKPTIYLANFYRRFAQLNFRMNDISYAESNYKKSLFYSLESNYYPYILDASQMLDSIFKMKNNLSEAYKYKTIYLDNLLKYNESQKSDDILKLSFENENTQRQIEEKKQEELTEKKHNVQYSIIFICLMSCFLILMILGSIKVPKFIIKGLGYISFIFLFELIILILDEKIHHLTHGAPLYILGIKVILIAFLMPFHHWVEHKVIHFLYEHQLINYRSIKQWFISAKSTIKEIYSEDKKVEVDNSQLNNENNPEH